MVQKFLHSFHSIPNLRIREPYLWSILWDEEGNLKLRESSLICWPPALICLILIGFYEMH